MAASYLDYLEREIAMLAAALGRRRRVVQYPLGRRHADLPDARRRSRALDAHVRRHFDIAAGRRAGDRDRSAGDVTASSSTLLRALGFNRLSFGVQDFAPTVQQAIHRIQSETR